MVPGQMWYCPVTAAGPLAPFPTSVFPSTLALCDFAVFFAGAARGRAPKQTAKTKRRLVRHHHASASARVGPDLDHVWPKSSQIPPKSEPSPPLRARSGGARAARSERRAVPGQRPEGRVVGHEAPHHARLGSVTISVCDTRDDLRAGTGPLLRRFRRRRQRIR